MKDATGQALGYFYFENESGRRMTGFEFIREVAARLRNDIDVAFYKPLPLPVSFKNIKWCIPSTA